MNETGQSQFFSVTHFPCLQLSGAIENHSAPRIGSPIACENPSIYLINVSLKWSVSIFESRPALVRTD